MTSIRYHDCGAPIYGGEAFCTGCGKRIGGGGTQLAKPDDSSSPVGSCPQCGHEVFEGDLFCTYCGYGLNGGSSGERDTDERIHQPAPEPLRDGVYRPVPAEPLVDDDHPTARPKSVRITREEARTGCQKTIEVDGRSITVELPAGIGWETKLDVPGFGYFDEATGAQGPLRLSFRIV